MKTTLSRIRSHSPCREGWEKLLNYLGKTQADDQELSLLTILESNGLDDTLWCLKAVEGFDREKRLYAIWCASQVKHLMGPESVKALEVATQFANGKATEVELAEARDAAWAAVARDAAWAATARDAAWAAAAAAEEAAWAAVAAADAAWAAAAAAEAEAEAEAAYQQARFDQAQELKRVLECVEAGKDPYQDLGVTNV